MVLQTTIIHGHGIPKWPFTFPTVVTQDQDLRLCIVGKFSF